MSRRIVTLCGSMRFAARMQEIAETLALERGWIVLTPNLHVLPRPLTEEEAARLGEIHLARIDLSDAIYVINEDGYIGEAVQREIAYARSLSKEILYMEA